MTEIVLRLSVPDDDGRFRHCKATRRHFFPDLLQPQWIVDEDHPGLVKTVHTCPLCGTVRTERATMPRQRANGDLTGSVRYGNLAYDWPEGYKDTAGQEEFDVDELRAEQIAACLPVDGGPKTTAKLTSALRATRSDRRRAAS